MKRVMSVIVMTSTECNLNCGYCYIKNMGLKKLRIRIGDIDKIIKNSSVGFDSVEFCWHGGEPLLMGIDFYQKVVDVQKQESKKRPVMFRNTIQSNGTLINEKWLTFFKKNDFGLGISFDAPEDINKIHRGTDVKKMVSVCKKIKEFDLPLSLLCVISELNIEYARQIFEFYKSLEVDSYSLLPLKEVCLKDKKMIVSEEKLFSFFKTTFDLWSKTDNKITHIEPISTMLKSILGQNPGLCSFSQPCLKRMIAIRSDGKIIPCSSLALDDFILGDIFKESLIRVLKKKETTKLRKLRERSIYDNCKKCEFLSLCRGGCRSDIYWSTGKYDGSYPFCKTRKKFFKYLENIFLN